MQQEDDLRGLAKVMEFMRAYPSCLLSSTSIGSATGHSWIWVSISEWSIRYYSISSGRRDCSATC